MDNLPSLCYSICSPNWSVQPTNDNDIWSKFCASSEYLCRDSIKFFKVGSYVEAILNCREFRFIPRFLCCFFYLGFIPYGRSIVCLSYLLSISKSFVDLLLILLLLSQVVNLLLCELLKFGWCLLIVRLLFLLNWVGQCFDLCLYLFNVFFDFLNSGTLS